MNKKKYNRLIISQKSVGFFYNAFIKYLNSPSKYNLISIFAWNYQEKMYIFHIFTFLRFLQKF